MTSMHQTQEFKERKKERERSEDSSSKTVKWSESQKGISSKKRGDTWTISTFIEHMEKRREQQKKERRNKNHLT